MARFKSTITDKGAEVLTAFLAAGKQLVLTSAAAGDGVAQVSPNTLTALVSPINVNTQIGEKTFVESNPSYMSGNAGSIPEPTPRSGSRRKSLSSTLSRRAGRTTRSA